MVREFPHVELGKIKELEDLIATFSEEEKVALEVNDFDLEKYQKQANVMGFENANKHLERLLESLQEDIENHREEKGRLAAGLTMTKLIARYLKLSPIWRIYVRSRLNLIDSSSDEDENVDTDKREKDEDESLVASFAALEREPDKKFVREVMDLFAKILTDVEEVL